jgi:hypothetical protein
VSRRCDRTAVSRAAIGVYRDECGWKGVEASTGFSAPWPRHTAPARSPRGYRDGRPARRRRTPHAHPVPSQAPVPTARTSAPPAPGATPPSGPRSTAGRELTCPSWARFHGLAVHRHPVMRNRQRPGHHTPANQPAAGIMNVTDVVDGGEVLTSLDELVDLQAQLQANGEPRPTSSSTPSAGRNCASSRPTQPQHRIPDRRWHN